MLTVVYGANRRQVNRRQIHWPSIIESMAGRQMSDTDIIGLPCFTRDQADTYTDRAFSVAELELLDMNKVSRVLLTTDLRMNCFGADAQRAMAKYQRSVLVRSSSISLIARYMDETPELINEYKVFVDYLPSEMKDFEYCVFYNTLDSGIEPVYVTENSSNLSDSIQAWFNYKRAPSNQKSRIPRQNEAINILSTLSELVPQNLCTAIFSFYPYSLSILISSNLNRNHLK